MTDQEITLHRFKNPHKSTAVLAKEVGLTKEIYEAAVMKELHSGTPTTCKRCGFVQYSGLTRRYYCDKTGEEIKLKPGQHIPVWCPLKGEELK